MERCCGAYVKSNRGGLRYFQLYVIEVLGFPYRGVAPETVFLTVLSSLPLFLKLAYRLEIAFRFFQKSKKPLKIMQLKAPYWNLES